MNQLRKNNLKSKLRERKVTFGSWVTIGHPIITEIMANSGFEWLTIDMEHSAITLNIAQDLIRTIEFNARLDIIRLFVTFRSILISVKLFTKK